jgi:hypothetical protein
MTDILIIFGRALATVGILLCLLVVATKVIWNVGLAYAMIREDLRGVYRGWSAFPLIEIVPLLVAIGLSFLVSGHKLLSPRMLSVWGFAAILGSYCHLALVALLYGIYHRRKKRLQSSR